MKPPTIPSPRRNTIPVRPLSQSSFQPFGTVITSPVPATLNHVPDSLSSLPAAQQAHTGSPPVFANQDSGLKYSDISRIQNTYGTGGSKLAASPRMSLFSCFPRPLRWEEDHTTNHPSPSISLPSRPAVARLFFDVRILERHPFTSQTFIPLSYGYNNTPLEVPTNHAEEACYLVVVAPTLVGQSAVATTTTITTTVQSPDGNNTTGKKAPVVVVQNPPDLENLQAFVARPGQAVTYAPGTWHAPMVVVGSRRVDFVVVQFMNGLDEEDCQEVYLDKSIPVEVGKKTKGVKAML